MTELPKFVARHGYRHEVIVKASGQIYLRQSPAPRWGRSRAEEVKGGADAIRGLETWDAYKARLEAGRAKKPAGTCQICGRHIHHAHGVIAHHGYERPVEGYQTASCPGARHLPFEKDRTVLGEHIESLKKILAGAEERLEMLIRPDFAEDLIHATGRGKGRAYEVAKHGTPEWKRALRQHISQRQAEIATLPATIAYQQKRYDEWKPKA